MTASECQKFKRDIWNRLGFGSRPALRPDDEEEMDGFTHGWLIIETVAELDWRDRLRILLTGRIMVQTATKTDNSVGRTFTRCGIGILPPEGVRRVENKGTPV